MEHLLEFAIVGGRLGQRTAGQWVMKSIAHFITQELKLRSTRQCARARPQEQKFLAFSSTAGADIKPAIAPKSLDRRIGEITRRATGVSIEATMEELPAYPQARLFRLLPNACVAAYAWWCGRGGVARPPTYLIVDPQPL
jgi:hypothetical protein